MVSKLSTSQFRYKVTKLILYNNYKRPKISKDFRFGKLFNLSKFPHSLFSTTYKIFWTTLFQSDHLSAYLLRIHPISAPSIIFHHHPLVFAMFLPCHLFFCLLISSPFLLYHLFLFQPGALATTPVSRSQYFLSVESHPLYFTALNRCHIWALRHNYISIQH